MLNFRDQYIFSNNIHDAAYSLRKRNIQEGIWDNLTNLGQQLVNIPFVDQTTQRSLHTPVSAEEIMANRSKAANI
jgi:hypothetical protein